MPQCHVCLNAYSTDAQVHTSGGDYLISCEICGQFFLTELAFEDYLDPLTGAGAKLSRVCRARIAHKLRTASTTKSASPPRLTPEILEPFIRDGCPGPSPDEQATKAILHIGDEISRTGTWIEELPVGFFAAIGAPSPHLAGDLLSELHADGLISGLTGQITGSGINIRKINLTLRGWQRYQEAKRGKRTGDHGFLAMKFGDETLERLARDVIKPIVKSELNINIVDMRDVARAGVIDNIMRAQIRDAAFVVADLTHDNLGAYWEAGHAEGLGKPVIYICEKAKFNHAKTHFDTNHCTTVLWDFSDLDTFKRQLIATIRRSLNLL